MGKKDNEIQGIDKNSYGMRVRNGDKTYEYSPEMTQQIYNGMIGLANGLISKSAMVTVESFKFQVDCYYAELRTYLIQQEYNSQKREQTLRYIESITNHYMDVIDQAILRDEDDRKIKALRSAYQLFASMHLEAYRISLDKDASKPVPEKPSLIKSIFTRGKK